MPGTGHSTLSITGYTLEQILFFNNTAALPC